MSLSESQNKFFMKALKIESDRVEQFLDVIDESSNDYDLYDLMDEKYEEKSKDLFKKLYREGCTQKQLLDLLKEENKSFKEKIDEELLDETEVMGEDLFGIDHINFEWTKNMIKQAKKEEDLLNKSKKLKTWEHGYKNTDYNIQELDESIKELISEHLRNIKSSSKKTKKRHKTRKLKRKQTKKKPQTKKPKRKQTKKKSKRSSKKINKIIQLQIPNNRNIRWAWLISEREDGRYIVRYPKKDILINRLDKKRNKDFYSEKLAPKNSKIL